MKDFNFYLGPKSIGFNTELSRMYNERQNRNALDPSFIFRPTYLKNFTWVRNYDLKYDISKNIKFSFVARNNSIILEPAGIIDPNAEVGTADYANYQTYKDNVRSAFLGTGGVNPLGGFTLNYGHNYDVSYKVPFDKLPLTDWMSANISMRSSYDWQRAPLSIPELGNTIQNSRNFTVNGQFNMVSLYNKVGFLKKINTDGQGQGRGGRGNQVADRQDNGSGSGNKKEEENKEDGEDGDKKDEDEKEKKKREGIHPVWKTTGRLVMSFRNLSLTYSETDGMLLP